MHLRGLLALAAVASLGFGCSDTDKTNDDVAPGGSDSGGANASGGSAGNSASGNAGSAGSFNLGGSVGQNDGGTSAAGGDGGLEDLPSEVNVIITADNAYGFGYGTKTALANYFGGVENQLSADIFLCPIGRGPEQYVVPAEDANAGGYLYIIGYADKSTTQGVIAKFFREGAAPVYTGAGKWEVCATGQDYDPPSGGPDLATINDYIGKCNAGELDPTTSSVGWVDTTGNEHGRLTFGEDHSTERDLPTPGNEFPVVCEIEPSARWMWFDWQAPGSDKSPFIWPEGSGNVTKDFLIFRLGADQVPS